MASSGETKKTPPEFDGKAAARKLPTGPGVYLYRDEAQRIFDALH